MKKEIHLRNKRPNCHIDNLTYIRHNSNLGTFISQTQLHKVKQIFKAVVVTMAVVSLIKNRNILIHNSTTT